MEYILPDKSLLEKKSVELNSDKNYYYLSKLIYKKDMNDLLVIPVGIDKQREKYYMDLTNISGIFIGGETGSGKSIFINSIIVSLLFKNTPDDFQLLFIDMNKVELGIYGRLPHMYFDLISDTNTAIEQLQMNIELIKIRQEEFVKVNAKNITEYNQKSETKMKHVVIVIDEAKDILDEDDGKILIQSIIKDGAKFGIHLILSTSAYYKESFDKKFLNLFDYVLTFDLASKEQANYIKCEGAELLKTSGDALIKCRDNSIINLQTPYVSEREIKDIVDFINEKNIKS